MNPIMFQSHDQRCKKKTTDAKKLLKLSSVPFPAALAWYADQPASKKAHPTASMESCGVGKNSSSNPINFGSCPNPNH
jgi:hypothetical protein